MEIIELLKELAEGGEARIEVSLRLMRDEKPSEKNRRPYDREGRLDGYRSIAEWLGSSVNYAMKLAKSGQIRTYSIGRKIYAYRDEVMEDLSEDGVKTSTVKGILDRHGYATEKVDRVYAKG